jgi:hypothetical protein
MALRCGECGDKDLEMMNWKGRKIPYMQYEWVQIALDFYTLGCPACGNLTLRSSECAALDKIIEESLRQGTNHKP